MKKSTIIIVALLLMASVLLAQQKQLYKVYEDYFPLGTAINPQVDLVSKKRMDLICLQYNSITPSAALDISANGTALTVVSNFQVIMNVSDFIFKVSCKLITVCY